MDTERAMSDINKRQPERRYSNIPKSIPTATTPTTRRYSLSFSRNLKQSDVDLVTRPSTTSYLDQLWRKKMSCLKSKTVVTDDESDSPASSSRRNSDTDDVGRPLSRRGSALLYHVFSSSHSSPPPRQQFFPIRPKDKAPASQKGKAHTSSTQARRQSLPAAIKRQNKRSASVPDIHQTSIGTGWMTPGGQVAAGFVPMLEHLKNSDARSVGKKKPNSKPKSKSTTTTTTTTAAAAARAPTVAPENRAEKVLAHRHSWNSSEVMSEGSLQRTMSIKERRRRSKLNEGSSVTGVEDDVVERLKLPLATNIFLLENGLVAKDSGYYVTPLQLGAAMGADNVEGKDKRQQQIAEALDSVVVSLSSEITSVAERLPLSATSSMYADNGASMQGSIDQDQYLKKRDNVVAAAAEVGVEAIPSIAARSPALGSGKEGKRESQIWRQQLLHDSLLFSFGSKGSRSAKPSPMQQHSPQQHSPQQQVPEPESPHTLWHRHLHMQHKHTESNTTELKSATRVLQYVPIMDAKELARRVEEAAVTPSLPVPPPSGMTLAGSLNFRKKVVTPVAEVTEERSEKRKSVPIMDVNTIEADVFGKGLTDEEGGGADEDEQRVDATGVIVEIVDVEEVESAGNSSVSLETAFHYVYDYLGEEYFQISEKVTITHEEPHKMSPYPKTATDRNRSIECRLKAPQAPIVSSQSKHHCRPSSISQSDLPHLKYTSPPPLHLQVVSSGASVSTCGQEPQENLNVPPLPGYHRRRSSPVGLFDHFDSPARTPPLGHYPSSPSTASAFSEDDEGEAIEL